MESAAIQLAVGPEVFDMETDWSSEEISQERRLVNFRVTRGPFAKIFIHASQLSPENYNPVVDDLVVSCIRWREKGIHVVTSVDIILVLEHLVGDVFDVEEKSRVRRNLQFLKPYTITRSAPASKRLFHLLMSMKDPQPRNIEKDLKVFRWKDLFVAVDRVLSKYSINPQYSACLVSVSSLPPFRVGNAGYTSRFGCIDESSQRNGTLKKLRRGSQKGERSNCCVDRNVSQLRLGPISAL